MSADDISALRKTLGLTLKEFGRRVGVGESAVSLWESGQRHPTYAKMLRLNALLDEARRITRSANGKRKVKS